MPKLLLFFWAVFLIFCLLLKKHYKNRVFDDFEMLIFSFFGQKSRVNNLAMVGSITWPSFWPTFCPERWPSYWPYCFHTFFVKTCFFFSKISFSLQKEEYFWKTKEKQKNNKKEMAKLLTYDGQVIDPTAHIYIHIYIYVCVYKHPVLRLYE